jgi:Na+/H+ antiporter NhaD/arsenite permease-like protein
MIYLASFVIAIIFAFLFTGYRGKGSAIPAVILFFILFMAGLSTPFWLVPFGPVWWGVSWVQLFVVMLVLGLLFAVPSPGRPDRDHRTVDDKEEVSSTTAAVSIFAWSVLFILLIAFFVGWYRAS